MSPDSELVAVSRDTDILGVAICDTNVPISLETLKNIETESSYNKRRKIDNLLKSKNILFRGIVEYNITKLHIVKKNEKQTFLGRCDFLL